MQAKLSTRRDAKTCAQLSTLSPFNPQTIYAPIIVIISHVCLLMVDASVTKNRSTACNALATRRILTRSARSASSGLHHHHAPEPAYLLDPTTPQHTPQHTPPIHWTPRPAWQKAPPNTCNASHPLTYAC